MLIYIAYFVVTLSWQFAKKKAAELEDYQNTAELDGYDQAAVKRRKVAKEVMLYFNLCVIVQWPWPLTSSRTVLVVWKRIDIGKNVTEAQNIQSGA